MPIKITPKLEDEFFDRIANGERLTHIIEDKHMPSRAAIYWRLRNHPDFEYRYDLARQERADLLFDEIVALADGDKDADDTNVQVQRDRLKVDARKWAVGKLFPQRYGDTAQVKLPDTQVEQVEHITRIVLVAEDEMIALPAPEANGRSTN